LREPYVRILPFTDSTAEIYASIRGELGISPADAIHLASAAEGKADLFLTNDHHLIGKQVEGIQFIAGLDLNLY
jgi:predicted nucleic acid-binding protein